MWRHCTDFADFCKEISDYFSIKWGESLINCLMSRDFPCYGHVMQRLLHAGIVFYCSTGMAILAWLPPNPAGFGTHQALGLPACLFKSVLGIPCPSCGLTTSLAHLLHGEIIASWTVHPAGLFFFAAGLLLIAVNLYGIVVPFRWGVIVARRWFHRTIVSSMGVFLLMWVVRLSWR